MATEFFRLTLPPPAEIGDTVQVGKLFFKVDQLEPLYYPFRNLVANVDVGMVTQVYPVPDLIPSSAFLFYISQWGINGRVAAQIRYQSNSPRNTVGARSTERLDRFQANYLRPFTFRFVIVAGDTLELDILAEFANVRAAVWFYGWKFHVAPAEMPQAGQKVVVLDDVRQI